MSTPELPEPDFEALERDISRAYIRKWRSHESAFRSNFGISMVSALADIKFIHDFLEDPSPATLVGAVVCTALTWKTAVSAITHFNEFADTPIGDNPPGGQQG